MRIANEMLAAEVRMKFGEALAAALKLSFTDQLVEANQQSFNLIAARVIEGATPPLEQNMALVELNRLKSMRETAEGKVEVAFLELRNLMGMPPEKPLRLRGDFDSPNRSIACRRRSLRTSAARAS